MTQARITIKDKNAITQMTELGKIASSIMIELEKKLQENTSTEQVDQEAKKLLEKHKVKSTLKTHLKFPKHISISVNNIISGGIPSDKQILKSGDIIKINLAINNSKYHIDTTRTFIIESGNLLSNRLIQTAEDITKKTISYIKPNIKLGDLGNFISKSMPKNQSFSIIKDLCGHGIGADFIEDTYQIKNEGTPEIGLTLQPGMTFTIEPAISAGKQSITIHDNNSCSVKDKSICALFSHTILITETGAICLTKFK